MFKGLGNLIIAVVLVICCGLFTNVFAVPTIEQALDVDTLTPPLTFTTGGDAPWYGQTGHSVMDGIDAAQSGHITHNQRSWMETTVTGPGDLSFIWMVSSENGYDWLTFYADDILQSAISGEFFGAPYSFGNPPLHVSEGTFTLRWKYAKDTSDDYPTGSDAGWVDTVMWTPSNTQYTLAVTKAGTGSGTVTSDSFPAGIDCANSVTYDELDNPVGNTCSVNYNSGTPVTLTATADTGSTFTGWSGGGCSSTDPCLVTMSAAQNVTATFTLPTVQFSAATSSGSEATTPAAITVTLSAVSGQTVTVGYATTNGTATAGSDYTATSGTLTFAPGDVSKTINVTITNDTTVEGNETFTVTLSSPTNATLGTTTTHTYTINNDDNYGSIQFSSPTYSVGEAGPTVTITATRTGGSSGIVGVSYATSNGTATAGSDYTTKSGTLSWSNLDTTSKTFTVSITNDILNEANETFTVTLSSPTGGATLGSPGSATVTITDNDTAPTVQWTAASQASASESGTMTVTAGLSAASGLSVTVPFTVTGTATGGGTDYTITASPITIPAGSTTGTATITITSDTLDENNETVILTMGTPTNATLGTTTVHTATITDNDTAPTVQWTAASQASASESGTMTVTAGLSAASGQSVTVPFTVTGTAIGGGTDYTITASPITIPAGSTTGTATITITSDTLDENNETVILTMGTPTNATLGTTTVHTATITDDDPAPTVQFSAATSSGSEATTPAAITVTLSAISGQTVSVGYATTNGTATAGSDYTATSGTLTFTPGVTSNTINVPITNDTVVEGNETFTVTLSSPSNATLGTTTTHTYTIQQNSAVLRATVAPYTETRYSKIQDAFNDSSNTNDILMWASDFYENLNFDRLNISVMLKGGYNEGFSSVAGATNVHGSLTISRGTVVVKDLIIK